MTRFIYFILLSILLHSCESVVELDIEQLPSTIAVNSLFAPPFNPNAPPNDFEIQLFKSRIITSSDDFSVIPDATVELFQNKELLETLSFDTETETYKSNFSSPQEGASYLLKVNHPDYSEVLASSTVPVASVLGATTPSDKKGRPSPIQDGTSIESLEMSLEVTDAPGNNYYHILFGHQLLNYNVIGLDTILIPNPNSPYYLSNFALKGKNEDGAILFEAPAQHPEQSILHGAYLTDENFNAPKKTLTFTLQYTLNPAIHIAENMIIEVRTVSKEYYDFHTSAIQNIMTGSNPFSNEPVGVMSNIQNGLGIFAGYSFQAKSVKLH